MSKDLPPSRTAAQFVVRLPDGMRDRIAEEAKAANRSMNSHLVHILQNHFETVDDKAVLRERGIEEEQKVALSLGLKEAADRAAVLKVLLIEELLVLKRRVDDLGGRDAVMQADKHEIAQRIAGPRIEGTDQERTSYYSKRIGASPLTTLLTTEELDKIASRVVAIENDGRQLISQLK
jgi:hypothetical protein